MESAEAEPLRPGDVISRKYELVRVLGHGGMGIVFEAVHKKLHQRVAIKMLRASRSPETVTRFAREARVASKLTSINAVRVLDVDELPDGRPYLVMEYLRGSDLSVALDKGEVFSIEDAADYVQQAAAAMVEAHALKIIHRDLKPSNLFLCTLGSGTSRKLVKVVDFGISRAMEDVGSARVTDSGQVFGTPYYMSPEHARSLGSADTRSDIWSLGVILFELLTGRVPFEGTPVNAISAIAADPVPRASRFRADLPKQLEDVIMKALEKDPDKRYQTAAELMDALAPFAPADPIEWILGQRGFRADGPDPAQLSGPLVPSRADEASATLSDAPSPDDAHVRAPRTPSRPILLAARRARPARAFAVGALLGVPLVGIAVYTTFAARRAPALPRGGPALDPPSGSTPVLVKAPQPAEPQPPMTNVSALPPSVPAPQDRRAAPPRQAPPASAPLPPPLVSAAPPDPQPAAPRATSPAAVPSRPKNPVHI